MKYTLYFKSPTNEWNFKDIKFPKPSEALEYAHNWPCCHKVVTEKGKTILDKEKEGHGLTVYNKEYQV